MRWPKVRRLRTRIIFAFALVLVLGQGLGFWLVSAASDRNAQRELRQELAAGERVFDRVVSHNRSQLAQAARVLAADYAFREAIATRDADTIASALENHGARIDAASMQLIDKSGVVIAESGRQAAVRPPPEEGSAVFVRPALLQQAVAAGFASTVIDGLTTPLQVVVVPVRAPALVGWIAVGHEINDMLASDLRRLTGLEVTFLRERQGRWHAFGSTLEPSMRRALDARLLQASPVTGPSQMYLDDVELSSRTVELEPGSGVMVVLQRALAEKLANYAPLRNFLIALALAVISVSLLFSVWLASGITRSLNVLNDGAARLRAGDYGAPIALDQDDEVGTLARSFNGMRQEIATREEQILRLAYEDPLTALPNRASFIRTLETAIAADASDAAAGRAVLLLDLDRFRPINEALGHAAGDDVLRQVGERLLQVMPPGAQLARLGADEFAALLPAGIDVERTAKTMLDMLKAPIVWELQSLDVGASIGIAIHPQHGRDGGTLLRHADIAMTSAKRSIHGMSVYDSAVDVRQQEHLSLLGELRRAVESDELRVFYQPKIDLSAGTVKGVEALVRWQHATRGLVPPVQFMPYAEQTGFVRQVTGWMLARSIAQCGEWLRKGLNLQVSINVSTRDLIDDALPDQVERLLALHDVPPTLICLEITESSVMDDPERALRTLNALAALGVELSIDDFGTGFSSLAYLRKLPVSELKIDRAFVMNMLTDAGDLTIVRSTIDLAHNLGLRVVAEGVESEGAMMALEACGCDMAQGYYASKPVPADVLLAWLGESRWNPVAPQRGSVEML